MCTEQVVAFS